MIGYLFSRVSEERGCMEKKTNNLDVLEWIDRCEKSFVTRLDEIARKICEDEKVRLIRLSGPTCSGKTTVANMLISRFAGFGKRLHLVSIDDFYYDKEILHAKAEKDTNAAIDYDSIETIDLEELKRFVREIFTLESSHCPIFDFKKGRRVGYRTLESKEKDVFVFEGIQAVYPEITDLFASLGHESVGIYISPESEIDIGGERFEPNEIRLLRRLVRDYNFRESSPDFTLRLWTGVRQNEEKNIFPYAADCKYHIDSTMAYEIGILKPYLRRILPIIPRENRYFKQAEDILKKIAHVEPISDSFISPDSLYKEFV